MIDDDDDDDSEVPEGAAVLPEIPPELGVHPLLLAVLHAVVFFDGSEAEVVNGEAAEEALEYIAGYLQRLEGNDLRKVQEDLLALTTYAREEKWPKQMVRFFKDFLDDFGMAGETTP